MPHSFSILFVDDEEIFLTSTAELLRREGFACDCAGDVDEARRLVQHKSYDLVIADVKMPGNCELEFVRQLAKLPAPVSVILVTGYPSLNSAVQSIELPVLAYLIKPFELDELVAKVRVAARNASLRHKVRRALAHLRKYRRGLVHIDESLRQRPQASQSFEALIAVTLQNIVHGLVNLQDLVDEARPPTSGERQLQYHMPHDVRDVLRDAVATLEHTKGAFKSKELAELRKRLEDLIKI